MENHLEIGRFNELKIKKETTIGVYLDSDAGEILMPRKYVPLDAHAGDNIRVFVYRDSEERLIATTLTPSAVVGEFACLKVVAITRAGAFLDWGLKKICSCPTVSNPGKWKWGENILSGSSSMTGPRG